MAAQQRDNTVTRILMRALALEPEIKDAMERENVIRRAVTDLLGKGISEDKREDWVRKVKSEWPEEKLIKDGLSESRARDVVGGARAADRRSGGIGSRHE